MNRRNQFRNGFTGGIANPQFDYDHRQDSALFLDPDFVKRKLRAMQTSYDEYADLAACTWRTGCDRDIWREAVFTGK